MRSVALDVHRDFCEVAIKDESGLRLAGRVKSSPAELELFAQSFAPDDQVALEHEREFAEQISDDVFAARSLPRLTASPTRSSAFTVSRMSRSL
jgi:hypothetical protein